MKEQMSVEHNVVIREGKDIPIFRFASWFHFFDQLPAMVK